MGTVEPLWTMMDFTAKAAAIGKSSCSTTAATDGLIAVLLCFDTHCAGRFFDGIETTPKSVRATNS